MKKFPIVLTALLITTVSNATLATNSKQQEVELKEWTQRKDDMQPLQLKDLIEENHLLKTSKQELTLTQQENESLLRLKAKIDSLRRQRAKSARGSKQEQDDWDDVNYSDLDTLFAPQSQEGKATKEGKAIQEGKAPVVMSIDGLTQADWSVTEDGHPYIKGIIFKVQMGAYKKRDLSNVLEKEETQEVFEQEQEEDINKYTLRHFRNYWKANQFKKELRVMGLRDAWIVAFKDGKRVPLKAVLQEILPKKK